MWPPQHRETRHGGRLSTLRIVATIRYHALKPLAPGLLMQT